MAAALEFDLPDLAARVEALKPSERDTLPFGAVELDREGVVLNYNETESRLSGYGKPLGKNFFEVSRSPNKAELKDRITKAMEAGKVDLDFSWIGGLGASERELRMRVQSSSRGGVWLFIARDDGRPAHARAS
ncbi:MAG: hypothetical protein JO254_02510 [Pseudolabrys sp.]|nr:hypothetical protein [Pseudolabrys sp.]